jgi:glycosyltransferase involved in cell wall biosynthesis
VLVSALFGATVAAYGATAWMQTWGERVPALCATVHASLPRADAQGPRAHLQVRAAHAALRRAETVVAVSQSVAQDLATHVGRAREQIDVIYNPIDIDAVQSGAQAPSPHDWFQDDVPVIVSAGRLHPQKDHRTLLRALARLYERDRVRAIILGEGPERRRLDEQSRELGISSDTAFPGFVDNPYAFMARADVFALPSPAEAFGNVVVEALACGTPVVATESGGPVEILRTDDATYGALVSPHDPAALADALAVALNRPVDQRRLQRRARDFDVPEAVDRYHALFQRIVRGAS